MGNNSSSVKSAGDTPASPISSSSSTTNSRKVQRSTTARKGPTSESSYTVEKVPITQDSSSAGILPAQHNSLDETMGNEHSKARVKDELESQKKRSKAKTTPVKVPRGSDPRRQRGPDSQFEPSGPPRDPNFIPHSNLNFPPRLPLPIQEEIHAPGSPIITAQGISSALHEDDVEGVLPRQSSVISSTTIDDDEIGDELQPNHYEGKGRVPTWVHWTQGGDKVYATGTFTNWDSKFRMNRDPVTKHLSVQLKLAPGTHYIKFIVDGEMKLSEHLDTAVDHMGILINYIEVSADDVPKEEHEESQVPEGVYPPQVLPQGIEAKDHAPDSVGDTTVVESEKSKPEPIYWGRDLPLYLYESDKLDGTHRFARSSQVVGDFSAPPGLPLFLGKSIMNGMTPMKDDNSVLNMPNHTVLNHLATSSIRNEVLATSITTRYIRKYVTTVVYKPTEDGD